MTFPSVEMAEAALQDRTKQLAGYAASPRWAESGGIGCSRFLLGGERWLVVSVA